jgi:diguanylate cyclase (GGDEF)-like protein/PAS domain S-box-containing protein
LERILALLRRRDIGHSRLPWVAAAFVVLVCGAILTLAFLNEWESRTAALLNAETDEANVATSLVQHAQDTFELADSVILALVNQLEADGFGPLGAGRIQLAIDARKSTLGRIHGLFVYDAAGRWLATSEKVDDLALFNNSDRDYFKQHRGSDSRQLIIGDPVKSRSGGQWVVTVSRRFNNPDGSFAGVVLATIDASYFSTFYKQFDLGPNGTVSLLTTSGIVLARSVNEDAFIGHDVSSNPLIRDLHTRPSESTYYFKSPFDGRWRLAYYKTSKRYPILILATEPKDEALAEWQQGAIGRLAVVAALTVLIALIGIYLVREMSQRQRIAAALTAKEADFRLLAEQSSDVVMRIGFDEKIAYISPSCERVLGWEADKLVGTPALAGVAAEDMARLRQVVDGLKSGSIEDTKVIYRNRNGRGEWIWLETTLRATRNIDTGQIDGVVAISRDMTEHKDLQQSLSVLAISDGLTSLANRRHFDDKLKEEWVRARRDGTSLSLLMMDVDYFKKFNDHYGHQAGDGCLKALAVVLAQEARRPGDLAARYGGEEFVLLLPGADEAGCKAIGERIRTALHELALPHVHNPITRTVTVSLGGATAWPSKDGPADPMSLVAAADRALYAAKHDGRDRLVLAGQVIAWRDSESA